MTLIYKIVERADWRAAEKRGTFEGAAIDLQDGYIHFSAAETVRETAARHFAGTADLLLVAVDATRLGAPPLKWEVSRGGALFPHLYAALATDMVAWVRPLPLGPGGHIFPEGVLPEDLAS